MDVKVNDLFELSSGKYITLDAVVYESQRYIFVNKLDENEEPTKKFMVFRCTDKGLIEEKNADVLKPVLSHFSETANEKLALIAEFYADRGENN